VVRSFWALVIRLEWLPCTCSLERSTGVCLGLPNWIYIDYNHRPPRIWIPLVGYHKKGYPKQKPKNCSDPKQKPVRQTGSQPKSPIRPRPPRRGPFARGPLAEASEEVPILRFARGLGTSEPTAPPRSRPPIGLGRTNRVPPRPRLPVGPRANWPCSASPEAGLVPQPRRLRLKSRSGRLSHPINAPSCPHYVSHDRQYAATGATGQRSNRLFTIPY